MNMPTVCDCGELVEFDDMKPIGNKLHCEDCFDEYENEKTKNIQPLYEMQDVLDKRIIKEKGLESRELLEEKALALKVELAECANEWRGFKYWSENQEPRIKIPFYKDCNACHGVGYLVHDNGIVTEDCALCETEGRFHISDENPLLEEYVDVLHFILSLGNMLDLQQIIIDNFEYKESGDEGKLQITMKFNNVFYYATQALLEHEKYPLLASVAVIKVLATISTTTDLTTLKKEGFSITISSKSLPTLSASYLNELLTTSSSSSALGFSSWLSFSN